LIKIYKKGVHPKFPDGGLMSQYLDNLKIDDEIRISGPKGKVVYYRNGEVSLEGSDGKKVFSKYKALGLVAGGTGITPMYQIMKHIYDNKED